MPAPQPSPKGPERPIQEDLKRLEQAPDNVFQDAISGLIKNTLRADEVKAFEKIRQNQNDALEISGISRVARGIIYSEGFGDAVQKDGKITSKYEWIEDPGVTASVYMANHAIPGQKGASQKIFRPVPFVRFYGPPSKEGEDAQLRTLPVGTLTESGALIPAEGFNQQDLTAILKMAATLQAARDSGELPHLHDNLNQLDFSK